MSSMMGNEPAGYRSPMAPQKRTVRSLHLVVDGKGETVETYRNPVIANKHADRIGATVQSILL